MCPYIKFPTHFQFISMLKIGSLRCKIQKQFWLLTPVFLVFFILVKEKISCLEKLKPVRWLILLILYFKFKEKVDFRVFSLFCFWLCAQQIRSWLKLDFWDCLFGKIKSFLSIPFKKEVEKYKEKAGRKLEGFYLTIHQTNITFPKRIRYFPGYLCFHI